MRKNIEFLKKVKSGGMVLRSLFHAYGDLPTTFK